jgi:thioredoxin reductase
VILKVRRVQILPTQTAVRVHLYHRRNRKRKRKSIKAKAKATNGKTNETDQKMGNGSTNTKKEAKSTKAVGNEQSLKIHTNLTFITYETINNVNERRAFLSDICLFYFINQSELQKIC